MSAVLIVGAAVLIDTRWLSGLVAGAAVAFWLPWWLVRPAEAARSV
ncbi:MAG: hypothetical protein AAFQ43_06690 [Bacteroidota bacterium]